MIATSFFHDAKRDGQAIAEVAEAAGYAFDVGESDELLVDLERIVDLSATLGKQAKRVIAELRPAAAE